MENFNNKSKRVINQKIILFLLAIVLFGAGWFVRDYTSPLNIELQNKFSKLIKMEEVMSEKWYYASEDKNVADTLLNRALVGMSTVDKDPYTKYFTKEEIAAFEQGVDQTYSGIGVEMSSVGEYPLVINVFFDSPAEKGGIKIGDYIVAIDHKDIKNMKFEDIRPMVVGEVGSEVIITYMRNNVKNDVVLKRANISYTVYSKVLTNNIGYLQISTFGSYTPNELRHFLDEYQSKGITKLIIDLRNNGGGYLDALVKMASCFLENGEIIFKQEYGDGKEIVYRAEGGNYQGFKNIIILTNENTASASEVFASALQENGKAKLVGGVTYGKGTSQTVYTFGDGSALKYTQTHWLTAKDHQINGKGITPDYLVNLDSFLETPTPTLPEKYSIGYNQVDVEIVSYLQKGLKMMGYSVDRVDGYFSMATLNSLNKFQKDYNFTVTSSLTNEVFSNFVGVCKQYYAKNVNHLDTQMAKALELLS